MFHATVRGRLQLVVVVECAYHRVGCARSILIVPQLIGCECSIGVAGAGLVKATTAIWEAFADTTTGIARGGVVYPLAEETIEMAPIHHSNALWLLAIWLVSLQWLINLQCALNLGIDFGTSGVRSCLIATDAKQTIVHESAIT
jgi:hypothetical protein